MAAARTTFGTRTWNTKGLALNMISGQLVLVLALWDPSNCCWAKFDSSILLTQQSPATPEKKLHDEKELGIHKRRARQVSSTWSTVRASSRKTILRLGEETQQHLGVMLLSSQVSAASQSCPPFPSFTALCIFPFFSLVDCAISFNTTSSKTPSLAQFMIF